MLRSLVRFQLAPPGLSRSFAPRDPLRSGGAGRLHHICTTRRGSVRHANLESGAFRSVHGGGLCGRGVGLQTEEVLRWPCSTGPIWDEDRPQLLEVAVEATLEWLAHKGLHLESLPEGDSRGDFHDSRQLRLYPTLYELSVARAEADDVRALRVRFVENRDYEGQSWTTDHPPSGRTPRVGGIHASSDRREPTACGRPPTREVSARVPA